MLTSKSAMLLLAAYTCALVVGCAKQRSIQLSAGAAAEATPNGTISTHTPTSQEIAGLKSDITKREAIDARYPGSSIPWGAGSEKVINVSAPGVLELEDGQRVRLDGMRCNERAIGYLRRVLQAKAVTVAVLPSTHNQANPTPAEVWAIDRSQQEGPSYSNINETAITSHWCEAEATPTNKHNARYAALAAAFGGG